MYETIDQKNEKEVAINLLDMKTNKLRKLRLLKGLSQECIASVLGISQKVYSDIENGKVSVNNEKL